MKKISKTKFLTIILIILLAILIEGQALIFYVDQDAPFFNDGNVSLLNAHVNSFIDIGFVVFIASIIGVFFLWLMEKVTLN